VVALESKEFLIEQKKTGEDTEEQKMGKKRDKDQ